MNIDGACHCGSITFTAEIDPKGVTICHCADCQILSGAPFRTVVTAPIEQFKLSGEPKRYTVVQGGKQMAQAFCPECGTPLFAAAPESPTFVVLRLGCVTQRAQLRPSAQIWANLALPWISELSLLPNGPKEIHAPPFTPGRGSDA
jgi:hypothetical protein